MKTENGLKKGEKVARRAIWLEGFLVISKFFAAFLSGSLVLKADAIHSASDILSIVTSWLGLKIAQKKPSKKFHYGFYKAENIGSLIISFLIFFAFWKMIIDGYSRLFSFSSIKFAIVGLVVSLADALILYFFGKYEIKVGKEINAESLIAMGKENRTHLFSSMTVFV
ncbi:MAG: cation diffusion facilitator family transporter, partial [Patescibacteria group bacterium]|nr:cation diffusion facilitator family transporter [Patescibacteria group bacterium]